MIQKISIRNFKSWAELDLDLAPISGLFGVNSSGKSAILHFLLLLKQTKETTDRTIVLDFGDSDKYVNLGSFSEVKHKSNQHNFLSWEIHWASDEEISISDPSERKGNNLFHGKNLVLKATVQESEKRILCTEIQYSLGNDNFSLRMEKDEEYILDYWGDENKPFSFIRNPGRPWSLPAPQKSYAFPDQARTYFQNSSFLADLELQYEKLIDKIYYLGPLRDYPKRQYIWGGGRPTDVGRRGERVVDALLAADAANQKRSIGIGRGNKKKIFSEYIAYWLKELSLIQDFKLEAISQGADIYRVKVMTSQSNKYVLITDVGFGISQVLPVLVQLFYVPEGSIVLLEQPEIHLHPSIQSSLADVIINAVRTRNIQVVVESHSEHLLRRLQRRLAEKTLAPENISLFFINNPNGVSKLDKLELSKYGEIMNWPPNFFGNEFTEIAETRKAILNQKIAENDK